MSGPEVSRRAVRRHSALGGELRRVTPLADVPDGQARGHDDEGWHEGAHQRVVQQARHGVSALVGEMDAVWLEPCVVAARGGAPVDELDFGVTGGCSHELLVHPDVLRPTSAIVAHRIFVTPAASRVSTASSIDAGNVSANSL